MKKILTVLLALFFALLLGTASADQKQVNPYAAEAHSPTYYEPEESGMTVALTTVAEPVIGQDAQWQLAVSGGEAPYSYQYYILTADWDTNSYRHWSDSDTFTFDFIQPGEYILLANVKDNAGNIASAKLEISLKKSAISTHATATTVTEKVAQVVSECYTKVNSNDKYAVALWLHDWLVTHAYYDYTFNATYCYAPEGVLLRGTGVCDSYAKAYVLLLQKAGIDAKRLVNYDHAWVGAKIEGEWYHIDPTWDDPGDYVGPVSGYENHDYFCVPDEVLAIDHDPWTSYNKTGYTAYACNYDIRSGALQQAIDENDEIVTFYTSYGYKLSYDTFYTYDELFALLEKATSYPVSVKLGERRLYSYYNDDYLLASRVTGREGYLMAYLMRQWQFELRGSAMYYTVTYNKSSHALSFSPDYSRIFIPTALVTANNRVAQGTAVTYTLQHTGSDPFEAMEYHVYNKYGQHISGWTGISEQYTFTPGAVGTYTVRVYLKTQHGEWMSMDSAPLTVVAPANAMKITGLRPNTTTAVLGQQLTFALETTGSSEITFMEYHIYNEYGQHLTGYTGISHHYSFTPTAPGKYIARVYMRTNHTDDATDLICDSVMVTVKGGERSIRSLVPASTTARVGDTLTFTTNFEGTGAIAWIEYHVYDMYGHHLTGYRGEGAGISGVYHYDTRSTGAGTYIGRVYLMTMDGFFQYVDSVPVTVVDQSTRVQTADTPEPTAEPTAEPTEEPVEEPAVEITEEPAAEPVEEPTPEPAGSSFETAIEAGKTIKAELEKATYYRVWLKEGTYTFTLKDTITKEGDGAELAVYSKSQNSLLKLRTVEGEAVGQITVPGGEYYLVLNGQQLELRIEEYVEVTAEPVVEPVDPVEEPAEPAAEPVEETADPVDEQPAEPVEEPVAEEPVAEPVVEALEAPVEEQAAPVEEVVEDAEAAA